MTEPKVKIIYQRENVFSSIVSDLFSFGTIVAAFWFNYTFIDGNNVLDALLFIVFFLFAIGRASNIRRYIETVKKDTNG